MVSRATNKIKLRGTSTKVDITYWYLYLTPVKLLNINSFWNLKGQQIKGQI